MERGPFPEDGVQLDWIHGRDACRVEVAETALELGRAAERLLHGHLLIEREPDQQGERLDDEQAVRGGVAGERKRGWGRHAGHGSGHPLTRG